jgi:hypothetical protein
MPCMHRLSTNLIFLWGSRLRGFEMAVESVCLMGDRDHMQKDNEFYDHSYTPLLFLIAPLLSLQN